MAVAAPELLAVWEDAGGRRPAERAVALAALAGDGDAAALTVGELDRRLIELRRSTFGDDAATVADCPGCGERLEAELRLGELLTGAEVEPRLLEVCVDGRRVSFRLPTAGDLVAVSGAASPEEARAALLDRCVLDGDELSDALAAAVAERMAAADPQAAARVRLRCPACEHEWEAPIDAGAFLWAELDAWAQRTLHEVHALASAYGWSEEAILALGPRRRVYLELAAG